jgi:chemotaxis signal transduction protein
MGVHPRVIIVETHRHLGVPVEEIEQVLDDRSYDIRSRDPLNADKGVYVIVAVLNVDQQTN